MPDLVHVDGKPFMMVPMHEYRRLVIGDKVSFSDIPENILDLLATRQDHPVKVIRKYRGMTQQYLAGAAGLSRPYLTEIETGKKEGSIAAFRAIATALNVSLDILIPGPI